MSDYVWIRDRRSGEFEIPIGAKILGRHKNSIRVIDDEGSDLYIDSIEIIKPMHITSIEGVSDMTLLGDLQEYSILRNLLIRYVKNVIYTYTGTMLVAINPFQVVPGLYSEGTAAHYRGRKIGELPPHIFAIADSAFENMRSFDRRQCVIITGESGAGKTESAKLVLQYLASISMRESVVAQQILESNPILEAFGNAQTVKNDNSSRFGKYIVLYFNEKQQIAGAVIQQYLLEKSRLVFQNNGEQNYHIFYLMLEGLSPTEKQKLRLKDPRDYVCLNRNGNLYQRASRTFNFEVIQKALKLLSFSDTETGNIFKMLASILHLGNVLFQSVSISNIDGSEIVNKQVLSFVAELLGCSDKNLETCLTEKQLEARDEKVSTFLGKNAAEETRDAFVKAIYGNLFTYIVKKINQIVKPGKLFKNRYISVLDIYGFENFEHNSFEQLCINYANEHLQQFFVRHVFKMEQEQYAIEGIDWTSINFVDNQEILNMLAMKPLSILALVDEESKFPKGTDSSMLSKIIAAHEEKVIFFRPKFKDYPLFGVNHFAGPVFYNVSNFLEKNRDSFSPDFRNLIKTSKNAFLKGLFAEEEVLSSKKKDTIILKFRESLEALMSELNQCEPFFIRCIKPNEFKKPGIFDRALCCRQLRYSGMMETAKIRQAGYPIWYRFGDFVERFKPIMAPDLKYLKQINLRQACQVICEVAFKNVKCEYFIGLHKVFLKSKEILILERMREIQIILHAVILQKYIRRWLCQTRYNKLRKTIVALQNHWRGRVMRMRMSKVKIGFNRLKARLRSRMDVYQYRLIRSRISAFQKYCRGYIVRKRISNRAATLNRLWDIRCQEEELYKREGYRDFKILAEKNWRLRLEKSSLKLTKREEAQVADDEDDEIKIVDRYFKFLD